jgi:hypothetical protein
VVKDATAVLRAGVRTLSVRRRRVVHFVEVLQQCRVGDLGGVKNDLAGLGIYELSCCQHTLSRQLAHSFSGSRGVFLLNISNLRFLTYVL